MTDVEPRGRLDPAPDPALDARVRSVLDSLTPDGRAVMAVAGKRLCDQLAAEAQNRRDLREASHEISAGMAGRTGEHVTHHEIAIRRAGGRADAPDDRRLAQELGRERLERMLGALDTDDAGREQPAVSDPAWPVSGLDGLCGTWWTGSEEWMAPEYCRRGPHDPAERHRALSGFEWPDDDLASVPPPREHHDEQTDEHVQEQIR